MTAKRLTLLYITADLVAAGTAWTLFFLFRKLYMEPMKFNHPVAVEVDQRFWLGLVVIPLFWVLLFLAMGGYTDLRRRFRTKELEQSFLVTFIGSIIIFFALLLDDVIATPAYYYYSFGVLFGLNFFLLFGLRFLLTSRTVKRVHDRRIGFNTVLVGGSEKAIAIHQEIEGLPKSPGNRFVGFVSVNGCDRQLVETGLPLLGKWTELRNLIPRYQVEEAIIAVESSEHDHISKILNELDATPVRVKIIPDMYDILAGSVKMTSIFGAPLIEVNAQIMPAWQFSAKRAFDIFFSGAALVLLSPAYLLFAALVKFTSPGPVIFSQERIGKFGRPFLIKKFRTMVTDAERNGPQLSSRTDPRITPVGRWLRRTRMDELPQFWNVLIGDMSMVGPRPERQYFIDEILQVAPHYRHLHKVRPGITSWGQVKFGYAESVDQMVRRLKFDILYIENMSLGVDLKILAYTVLIIFKGDGK